MTSGEHSVRRRCAALVFVVAMLSSPGSNLAAAAPAADLGTGGDTVRLIVKSRAGLPDAIRDRLLSGSGVRRRGHIPRIGATIVEIPRTRLSRTTAALRASGAFSVVEEDGIATATEIPNDPLFPSQWGALQINSPESWNVSCGSPSTLVAVLDTGVDSLHPDLSGQLTPGYDFVNDDADPSDDNGHGTAMTGIIVARANNGIGVAGIASASQVLPVKVLDANGNGLYSIIATGIIYAADNGARVINLSLAGSSPSDVLQSAVDYARAHDTIVVAAAGNSGQDAPAYPAALDGVVAVAATDQNERRAYFSNYGSWVSLSAPGVDIVTTTVDGDYAGATGTSPATALTSGAFALLLAANPTMTGPEAVDRMTANAVDLGTAGWDAYYGYGRVDAYAALEPGQNVRHSLDNTPPVVSLFSPSKESLVYGIVPIDVHANDNTAVVRVDLQIDGHVYASATSYPYEFAWDTTGIKQGAHRLRAYAYDANGNSKRTKQIRVYVTSGVGLLVKHVSIGPNHATGKATLLINALFGLPSGVVFDPASEAVTLDLTSDRGSVLSVTIPPPSLVPTRGRVMRFIGSSDAPGSDTLKVTINKKNFGNGYSLKISDTADTLPNVDSTLNVRVGVGTQVLTQSVTLRQTRTKLLLP
jgi:thermitase